MTAFHPLAAVAAGIVVTQLAMPATTIYLHRTLSHRSMTMRPGTALVFRTLLWLTTGIVARQWVGVHRKHHSATDTPEDPHSPVVLGFWRVQLTNAALYRRSVRSGVVERYARDLPPDRLDHLLFDHAWLGLGIGIGILVVLFGPLTGLVAAVIHTALYLSLNAAVNAVGHTFGSRPYPNAATNNQWLAWLTFGEGLHNNHHAAPTSARLALHRGERDPGAWIIAALVKAKAASLRHAGVHLKHAA